MKLVALMVITLLASCTNQGLYEAMQQDHCMQTTGKIYCNDKGTDYNDYKREREALLEDTKK